MAFLQGQTRSPYVACIRGLVPVLCPEEERPFRGSVQAVVGHRKAQQKLAHTASVEVDDLLDRFHGVVDSIIVTGKTPPGVEDEVL